MNKLPDPGAIDRAFAIFDRQHAGDPRRISVGGENLPWSLHYHRRMSHWLDRLAPNASPALRLAARSQHLRRWEVSRDSYPPGRSGYKRWRTDLGRFHAREAQKILQTCDIDSTTILAVGDFLQKKGLKTNPETQILEDVICLVFLENEFADFACKHEEDKILTILRKTWVKMSPPGHEEALRLAETLPVNTRRLLEKALAP